MVLDFTKKFEESEWELLNPKNISFTLCNSDNLLWTLIVNIKYSNGLIRGLPIGRIVQAEQEGAFKFVTNMEDKEYSYRMIMSRGNVFFFRRKKI